MTIDRPYVIGSKTSEAAAASMPRTAALDARARVFAAIHRGGIHGRTRQEVEADTGLPGDTVRPRCAELLGRGLIVPSGEIRRSPTGRPCEVLVAKEFIL